MPGTGGVPPSSYEGPFEEEATLLEEALKPSRQVDDAGTEQPRGAWLGSNYSHFFTPLRS